MENITKQLFLYTHSAQKERIKKILDQNHGFKLLWNIPILRSFKNNCYYYSRERVVFCINHYQTLYFSRPILAQKESI